MAEGYSTETLSVAETFIAGYLTAEWIRKNAAPTGLTPAAIAAAYQTMIDATRKGASK